MKFDSENQFSEKKFNVLERVMNLPFGYMKMVVFLKFKTNF